MISNIKIEVKLKASSNNRFFINKQYRFFKDFLYLDVYKKYGKNFYYSYTELFKIDEIIL